MTYINDTEWDAFEEFCRDYGLDTTDAASREEFEDYVRDMEEDRISSYRD